MSRSTGTGCPISFRCQRCRSTLRRIRSDFNEGKGYKVTLTGKTKRANGSPIGRIVDRSREYTCNDCGHRGWSAHMDLESQERREAKA